MSPQDRKIIEELMTTGAINPQQLPPNMPAQPGNMAAIQAALQNAPPQGGMVPTNVHSEPPALATPADNRVGVGAAQLGDAQDPLRQKLMQQQPVPGGGPGQDPAVGAQLDPTRAPAYGGMPTPAGPVQAPLPNQGPSPQDEELIRMMLAQGGM